MRPWKLTPPGTVRRLRAEAALHRALLDHHCDTWYENTEHRWRIDHWDEHALVRLNGDAHVTVKVRAIVEAQMLPFFRIRLGSGRQHRQPWSELNRVSVTVTGANDGPRWDSTTRWLPDGRLEVATHFRTATPKKGDEILLQYSVDWPGKVRPLMTGEADDFTYWSPRPLAYLRYRLDLPEGCEVRHELISLRASRDNFSFSAKGSAVELIAHDIAAKRRIGMRLDMR